MQLTETDPMMSPTATYLPHGDVWTQVIRLAVFTAVDLKG